MKWLIVILALISGVGTIPCLLYLIWSSMQDARDAEEARSRQEAYDKVKNI